ncbi:MAG: outer membrane beta-barrel protein [Candidatus Omnitrophota bacterium]
MFIFLENGFCISPQDIDININAALSQGYDDNITFIKFNRRKDLFNRLSLGVSGGYAGKRRRMRLNLALAQQLFYRYDTFNNNSQNISFSLQQDFSRYQRVSLSNTFSHSYEPRSFLDAFGRTTGRYGYYRNRFALDYGQDVNRRLRWGLNYGQDIDIASRSDIGNSYAQRIGVNADYLFGSRFSAELSYLFSRRSFDPGKDAITHNLSLGAKYYFVSRFFAHGSAGWDIVRSYDNRDYLRPFFDASLSGDIDKNTQINLGFGQRYYTNAYTRDLFGYRQVSAELRRNMQERLSCRISGFYGQGKYLALDIRDRLKGGMLTFVYDLSRNTRLDFSYLYTDVASNLDSREYKKNSLTLGYSIKF